MYAGELLDRLVADRAVGFGSMQDGGQGDVRLSDPQKLQLVVGNCVQKAAELILHARIIPLPASMKKGESNHWVRLLSLGCEPPFQMLILFLVCSPLSLCQRAASTSEWEHCLQMAPSHM